MSVDKRELRILSLRDAAAYCGVSYRMMQYFVNVGTVPRVNYPSKDGKPVRKALIDRRDLDEFIERNKARATKL